MELKSVHASQNWRWLLDPRDHQLKILLDNQHEHLCPYKSSRLVPLGPLNASFSVTDAEAYEAFSSALASHQILPPELIVQASLNYLIIMQFGRPQMPQSWYFQQQTSAPQYDLSVGTLIELNSGIATATFALVNSHDGVSECMLLDLQMPLSEIKTLRQFDVIKVLNNRLQPATALAEQSPCHSFQRLA